MGPGNAHSSGCFGIAHRRPLCEPRIPRRKRRPPITPIEVGVAQVEMAQRGGTGDGIDLSVQRFDLAFEHRSEEHTSELQSLMRISYAVFCLKKKKVTKIKNDSSLPMQHT